jgi:arsenate reductase-like glutaredoxin family protein
MNDKLQQMEIILAKMELIKEFLAEIKYNSITLFNKYNDKYNELHKQFKELESEVMI